MSRFWLGNFDFEHQLADPAYNRSAKLQALNAELSAHLLPLADSGDYVYFPEPLPDGFQQRAVDAGLIASGIATEPTGDGGTEHAMQVEPWGWSDAVVLDAMRIGVHTSVPPAGPRSFVPSRFDADAIEQSHWTATLFNAVRDWVRERFRGPLSGATAVANSRCYSALMECELLPEFPGDCGIFDLNSVERAICHAAELWNSPPDDFRWIIKADFSMSGRERICGSGPHLSNSQVNWIKRRLPVNTCLHFEPFVECIEEVSTQWHMSADFDGAPKFVGMTRVLCGHLGNFVPAAAAQEPGGGYREAIIDAARKIALDLETFGYFGPLGIDAMVYRGPDGAPAVRLVQDINARWTMGRVLLAIANRIGREADMYWLHVPTDRLRSQLNLRSEDMADFHTRYSLDITDRWPLRSEPDAGSPLEQINMLMDGGSGRTRLLLTTPLWIGDRPTNRTSVLCITQ